MNGSLYWNCFFVVKNTCHLKPAWLWLLTMTLATFVFIVSLSVSLFRLPAVCLYNMKVKEQRNELNIQMMEHVPDTTETLTIKHLRQNISRFSKELRELKFTVKIYEKLGKVMEKDSSLTTFGNKLHQNILITAVPFSGEVFLGELFNRNPDIFYLFEPFHSLKYFRENRPPDVYDSMVRSFMQGIFSCDFSKFSHFTEFLSRHYRALVHRLASRTLSSPPLCPEVVTGRYYNIRYCTYLRPPTLSAICKLHTHTVVKTTQIIDLERLTQLVNRDWFRSEHLFRVVELVRDPRALVYTVLRKEHHGNVNGSFFAEEARKICTQQLRNINYAKDALSSQPDMYTVFRYEDLISRPFDTLKRLYSLFGISHNLHVHAWLTQVLRDGFTWPVSINNRRPLGDGLILTTNLTKSLKEWRTALSVDQIRAVERECSEAMTLLDYEIFQ